MKLCNVQCKALESTVKFEPLSQAWCSTTDPIAVQFTACAVWLCAFFSQTVAMLCLCYLAGIRASELCVAPAKDGDWRATSRENWHHPSDLDQWNAQNGSAGRSWGCFLPSFDGIAKQAVSSNRRWRRSLLFFLGVMPRCALLVGLQGAAPDRITMVN